MSPITTQSFKISAAFSDTIFPSILAPSAFTFPAFELPVNIPVILRAPAHVTSPVTVPYISIEPVESRLPLTVKPFVITAVSAVPSFSSSLFGSSTPTALPISICAESFASSGSTLPLCLRVLTISSSEDDFFEKSLAVSFKSSLKSLKNPIRISSLG